MKTNPRTTPEKGFALVVTLSLMILLTIIAVGLLTLSSISLRGSTQGLAMATARSNARLALVIAIGELQKSIGPDQRVTATSEIVANNPAKPRVMGAWKSWDYNPSTANLDYSGKKQELFINWLTSDKNFNAVTSRDYVNSPATGDTVELIGSKSLGVSKADPADLVKAGKVPISRNNKVQGSYAWYVSDESVKARINAYRDPSQNQALWQKRALLAGHRANPNEIKGTDGSNLTFLPTDVDAAAYKKATEISGKLISLNQVDLQSSGKNIAKFRHHVSLYSTGLETNVREGGLKQDLSSAFGMSPTTMPGPYNNTKLYASTHKITGTSDPYWSALKGYHDVYKEVSLNSSPNNPVYYKAPQESVLVAQPNPAPPRKYSPMPVIERVELLFSVIARESHGPWSAGSTGRPELTRMIHLLYAPIITLHNPYNVSLKFDKLDLSIKGVPMAFNFTVNNQAQNNRPVPFNELFVDGADRYQKSFYLSISDWSNFAASQPTAITMKPGQTLVCGPYIDGNSIFGSDGHTGAATFFDYSNNLTGQADSSGNVTKRAKCKPGFLDKQVSFDVDWLTPNSYQNVSGSTDGARGVLIVKPTDQFSIDWKVMPNTTGDGVGEVNKFTVGAQLTAQGTTQEIGGLEFGFDAAALTKTLPIAYRYPDAKSLPNTVTVESIFHSNATPIRSHLNVKAFALFSAYARTANGGVYDNGTRDKAANGLNLQHDGRLAGRPFIHHNPARTPTVVDLKLDLPGRYSHELNVQPLPGIVNDIFNIDTTNRGYGLTSNKVTRGIKSGSYLELPTGPMQTLADFRRSNALTSALLPHFVQPVSNSYASPLISTSNVLQTGVVRYPLLDHSVLANHALYDRFYFSTFATYGNKGAESVFSDFMSGAAPLAAQAFVPYLPNGKTVDQAKSELFSGGRSSATAYQTAAEYQLVRGPFNVNSTDVEAWKAELSSMSGSMIQTLWASSGALSEKRSGSIPILPMSLVNGVSVGGATPADMAPKAGNPPLPGNIDNMRTNDWNGFRELTPYQLEDLAKNIVEEVRKRGPFQSMSEFVNRRIGPESDLTRTGALQAAIDASGINNNFLSGVVTDVRPGDVADDKVYKYATPSAATGNPAAGAPGWLSQGDLMRILEPAATVRSDTFVVRAYGETHDANGAVIARAYAEAVVQRMPEYVNPVDRPSVNVWDPAAATAAVENKNFGRRLSVVSFRWLSDAEI